MAVSSVSLPDYLRPWRQAGLSCLLCAQAGAVSLAAPDLGVAGGAASATGSDAAYATPRRDQVRDVPPHPVRAHSASSEQGLRRPTATPDSGWVTPDLARLRPPQAGSPPFSQALVDAWPVEWRALFARSKPAPLVWTYAELGADLTGSEAADGGRERSACLKQLIGHLHLRRGSSVFWPFAMPGAVGEDPVANPDAFQAGLDLLQAKAIIFMNPADLPLAGFVKLSVLPYQQHIVKGRLLLVIPPFAALLADEGKRDAAMSYLRFALASVQM